MQSGERSGNRVPRCIKPVNNRFPAAQPINPGITGWNNNIRVRPVTLQVASLDTRWYLIHRQRTRDPYHGYVYNN